MKRDDVVRSPINGFPLATSEDDEYEEYSDDPMPTEPTTQIYYSAPQSGHSTPTLPYRSSEIGSTLPSTIPPKYITPFPRVSTSGRPDPSPTQNGYLTGIQLQIQELQAEQKRIEQQQAEQLELERKHREALEAARLEELREEQRRKQQMVTDQQEAIHRSYQTAQSTAPKTKTLNEELIDSMTFQQNGKFEITVPEFAGDDYLKANGLEQYTRANFDAVQKMMAVQNKMLCGLMGDYLKSRDDSSHQNNIRLFGKPCVHIDPALMGSTAEQKERYYKAIGLLAKNAKEINNHKN